MPDTLDETRERADASVNAAEQEAAEAAELVAVLEDRVREGDESVTPEEIASARDLGRFAKLRAEATRRKATRAKAAARLAACEDLAAEMRAAEHNDEQIIAALGAVEAALTNLTEVVGAHNHNVGQWRRRMQELAVEAGTVPATEHGGLVHDQHGAWVAVGATRFSRLSAGALIGATVYREAARCVLADAADRDRRYDMRYKGEALSTTLGELNGLEGPADLRALIRSAA